MHNSKPVSILILNLSVVNPDEVFNQQMYQAVVGSFYEEIRPDIAYAVSYIFVPNPPKIIRQQ